MAKKTAEEKQKEYMGIPLTGEGLADEVKAADLNKGMMAQVAILEGLIPSMEGDEVMSRFVQYLHEIAVRQLVLINVKDPAEVKRLLKDNQDGVYFEKFKKAPDAAYDAFFAAFRGK